MRPNPQLDPSTKEIALGVRRPTGTRSGVERQLNIVATRLSGLSRFQGWLQSRGSFGALETGLRSRASNTTTVDDGDATTARDIVESAFGSWSGYKGDPGGGTGVYAQSSYDDYRSYLTTNGVAAVDADEHLQVITELFTAEQYLRDAIVTDLGSYGALEPWLQNRGWSGDEATAFTDQLQTQYTWSELETALAGEFSLDVIRGEFDHDTETKAESGAGLFVEDSEVTIRGDRIDFEPLNADESASIDPPQPLSWTMQTASLTVTDNQAVDIRATGTASTSADWTASVPLLVDGEVVAQQDVRVTGGDASVTFSRSFSGAPRVASVAIGDSSTIDIEVLLGGLLGGLL